MLHNDQYNGDYAAEFATIEELAADITDDGSGEQERLESNGFPSPNASTHTPLGCHSHTNLGDPVTAIGNRTAGLLFPNLSVLDIPHLSFGIPCTKTKRLVTVHL